MFVGEIRPPSGTKMIFLNGTTARIKWTLISVTDIDFRKWSFTSSDGKIVNKNLATIIYDNPPVIKTRLLNITVEPPATLVLNNVNKTYDGTYKFTLGANPDGLVNVVVFIVGKFNVP